MRPSDGNAGGHRAAALGTLLALAGAAGCGGGRPPLALRPEPVPYADTLPIAEPLERSPNERLELFESGVLEQLNAPVETGRPEALNLTRFDDVVNSAWFEHRIDRGTFGPEDVARGSTDDAGPDTSRALVVIAGKTEGVSPGFTVRDARGTTYLLKFDAEEWTGLGSAAGVIGNRLLYAAGYHVPEDHVVVFDSARLELGPEAMVSTPGGERKMTVEDLHRILDGTAALPGGRFRALASEFVPGEPKGPFLFEGVREDDPNDHYRHEYRRELRGLFVVSAWINHVDMRFGNTLDSYVEPGYLRHYLIDFASSLGSSAGIRSHTPRHGEEYQFDLWPALVRLATLGIVRSAGWENDEWEPIDPSVGWFDVEQYDPATWKPGWPNQAFLYMTDRDGYWGAKLVASFTEAHIRAAVRRGRLPPAAEDTVVRILVGRRDKTVAHWFGRVTPLEEVAVEPAADREPPVASVTRGGGPVERQGGPVAPVGAPRAHAPAGSTRGFAVTYEDLGIRGEIWTPQETSYRWRFEHPARGLRWEGEAPASDAPRQRIEVRRGAGAEPPEPLRPEGAEDLLAILEVTAVRPDAEPGSATVHLRWDREAERYVAAGLEH